MKIEAPSIGLAWGSPGGATAEISNIVEDLTKKRPKPKRIADLAGPNETIQLILDSVDWLNILAGILGEKILEGGWNLAKPKILEAKNIATSAFSRLIGAIREAKHAKSSVIFGLPQTIYNAGRHIGFEIQNLEPEDIAKVIYVLAKYGDKIESKLNEWNKKYEDKKVGYTQNSDCSVKLILSDDNKVQLEAHISSDDYKTSENITYIIVESED